MTNEQMLDSVPIADLVRALVKREYVINLIQGGIQVLMLPDLNNNQVSYND